MQKFTIDFQPIGIIHSPHQELSKTPIQPIFCKDIEGTIELDPQYLSGLEGLDGFSYIYVFFYFHKSEKTCLQLKPYLADQEYGVFATRAPHRPNKLGMSLIELIKIKNNILHVKGIDILDNTPLLDIKPYVQRFDYKEKAASGWQDSISEITANIRGTRNFNH